MGTPPGPSPSRMRRRLAWSLPFVLAALALATYRPGAVTRIDSDLYDAMMRAVPRDPPSGRVVIVDVDERSLASIGQWPWPRDVVGNLLTRIRGMGASTVAVDAIFAEPDRGGRAAAAPFGTSDPRSRPATTPADEALAGVLRAGGVVLGYAMTFDGSGTPDAACVLHPLNAAVVQAGGAGAPELYRPSGALCSLPVLAEAAGASGFLNAAPDSDGILRRVPLVMQRDGRLYPALALAAVIEDTGVREIAVRASDVNTISLVLGERRIPLDRNGNLLVTYLGKKGTFPYVSAGEVLAGRAAPDAFAGALVFVGATALGTHEDVATPVQTNFTGVEVQATVAENLLASQFVTRPAYASFAEAALVVLALPALWVVSRAGIARSAVAVLLTCGLLWAGAAWLFVHGQFVSPLLPTLGLGAGYVAAVIVSLREERLRAVARARQARGQAVVASAAKDEILRKVSHELRTPLTAIAGWAHLLGSHSLSEPQKRQAIATIRRNVKSQTNLIEHLVDTSSLAKGEVQLDLRRMDVCELLGGILAPFERVCAAKGIRLETALPPGGCLVSGDADRLRQVFEALCSNAAKFTPGGGVVRVSAVRAGEHVEIAVSDTGIGISQEFLPHVFEHFRQHADLTTQPDGGLGLGLAIVEHLVHLHGGSVTAESAGPHHGATFTVRLPKS